MKRFLIIGALALSLGACTTTQTTDTISKVQEYTRLACSFVPTAKTVAAIFTTGLTSAFDTATAICNAVTTAPLADGPGDRTPRVRGVKVEGKRV